MQTRADRRNCVYKWTVPILVVLVLLSAITEFFHLSMVWVFITSCLVIIPLAGVMGKSTEDIAEFAGPRIGGLISATFGNAVELIIGILALKNGLTTLVKASITGSILGNLLFVLGVSFFVGGIRHPIQTFNIRAARNNASLLLMSVFVAFILPRFFVLGVAGKQSTLAAVAAVVSFVLYLSGLYFALFTHRMLVTTSVGGDFSEQRGGIKITRTVPWSAVLRLSVATVLVGIESEWLVGSINEFGHVLGWSEMFLGVIVIAIVGNAAEHASAVWMAWRNHMELSLEIAVGSSLQVAMFVAPILFATSLLVHHPMPLLFTGPELASMGAAVLLVTLLMMDGESNWLEGAMAVGAYLVMAVGFFNISGIG
ncbi:calcium/proton exchanger [Alicyclobacillaceae bacterium I2511]|nr:calcium/proton exchanger [Alicyclobacillaceae bacterium I2511]